MRIKNITTKSGENLEPGSLTIIIGANDSGKSTFLRELYVKGAGISTSSQYRWRWVDDIDLEIDESIITDCREILKRSVLHKHQGDKDHFYLSDYRNEWGDLASGNESEISQTDYNSVNNITSESLLSHKIFRNPFFIYANCESRLKLQSVAGLAAIWDRATDALNMFHRREHLFQELIDSINHRFHYNLLLLNHVGTQLELGTSTTPKPNVQGLGDKNEIYRLTEEWKKENFTPIQESGHGLRSMVRILEALFDSDKKIKLIDEPEMHLYPAQKIWLGGKIAEVLEDKTCQILISTHDAHILQGILDKRPDATVLRFTNVSGERALHQWELSTEPTPTTDTFRADFLIGLFHNYCITVESESDRLFYKEMEQDCEKLNKLDLAYVPCRGDGGALNVARLSKAVDQRCAFILDLDVIFEKPNVIKNIVNASFGSTELPKLDILENIIKFLKSTNPSMKWKDLLGYTDKLGPDASFRMKYDTALNDALSELEGYGVFLVPNGSLESWAPDVENKTRFPENAPKEIRENQNLFLKVKTYLNRVGSYLSSGR